MNLSGILHLHLDCNRVDMDNGLNSDHLIGIRAKTAAEEVNRLRNWKTHEGKVRGEQGSHQKGLPRGSVRNVGLLLGEVYRCAGSQRIYRQVEDGCFGDCPWLLDPEWKLCL